MSSSPSTDTYVLSTLFLSVCFWCKQVLTQIDQLRQRDNVLILTTSNISEAIDLAFVDRADIKQYIGLPTKEAR
jgi:hypothetical protein